LTKLVQHSKRSLSRNLIQGEHRTNVMSTTAMVGPTPTVIVSAPVTNCSSRTASMNRFSTVAELSRVDGSTHTPTKPSPTRRRACCSSPDATATSPKLTSHPTNGFRQTRAPTASTQAPTPKVVVTTPTTTTTLAIAPTAGPGVVELVSCDKRAEVVGLANTGSSAISLSGYVLHDEGRKHEVALGQFGALEPGQRLAIVSGADATAGEGRVVWKRQNVWNNDGDVANLIAPDGTTTVTRC
jgi:hypothetical protein